MNCNEITLYISALEAENAALKEQRRSMVNADRFHNWLLTIKEVAAMHGVRPERVRDYCKRNLIPVHPDSTDGKALIRADVALTLNFDHLHSQKINLKY